MKKSNKSEKVSFEEAQKNIGLKVQKFRSGNKTPKPFASGRKINTIKGVIQHPERPAPCPAYTFYEDTSHVSVEFCVVVPRSVPEPYHPGQAVELTSDIYLERKIHFFQDERKDSIDFSNAIERVFIVTKLEPINGELCYRLSGGYVYNDTDKGLLLIDELLIPHNAVKKVDVKEMYNYDIQYWLDKKVIRPPGYNKWPFGLQMEFVKRQTTGVCNCTPIIGENCETCIPLMDTENNVIKNLKSNDKEASII